MENTLSLHFRCFSYPLEWLERYTEGCIYSSLAPSIGFNPRWDCTLSFQLQVPELALVRFVVEDHDHAAKNDFVGQFTLPFTSLRTGICLISVVSCIFLFVCLFVL